METTPHEPVTFIRMLKYQSETFQLPEKRLQHLALGAIILLVIALVKLTSRKKPNVEILLSDEIRSSRLRALEYCYHPREVMRKGYLKYPDQTFGIDTRDGVKVVIPPRFLDQLKSHPHLTFGASINNDMQSEYTKFGHPPEYVINAVKGNMNASLGAYIPILHKMSSKNVPELVGFHKDWTPVNLHDKILHLVGINNSRVFQGTAASLDDEWVQASTGYVVTTFDCIRALKEWPPVLRPLVFHFLPERGQIQAQWKKARERVSKSIRDRAAKGGQNLEEPPSLLDHLSSGKNAHLASDVESQLLYQMTLVAVGTVTTFASIVQAVNDLVMHAEYIPILREEIASLRQHRDADGFFTKEALAAMKKLDSFMKESQRLGAADLSTFQRAATADLTLPDGTWIPRGTKLEVNTCSIHRDERLYDDAAAFDGLRYWRLRQQAGEENKHLYYSVGRHDLAFGYGRSACPGRYLGQVNIKLIVAELLQHYDLRLPPNAAGGPKNLEFEAIVSPDPNFLIELRSREKAL